VDRLKAIGNGQVPAVARLAVTILGADGYSQPGGVATKSGVESGAPISSK